MHTQKPMKWHVKNSFNFSQISVKIMHFGSEKKSHKSCLGLKKYLQFKHYKSHMSHLELKEVADSHMQQSSKTK